MSLYSRLKLHGKRFGDDTRGAMPVEGVMASTFLIWWYVASFQFFDAYRQKNINLKAAYTVADMVSRETDAIDGNFVDGLNTLFDYLTFSNKPTWLRVSSVYWDGANSLNKVGWSYATGSHPVQNNTTIQYKVNQIPVMPVGDTIIIVETFMAYEPIFNIGLNAMWYDSFITTRPRFASQVQFENTMGTGETVHSDGSITPAPSGDTMGTDGS
jgi:hypothetical protein